MATPKKNLAAVKLAAGHLWDEGMIAGIAPLLTLLEAESLALILAIADYPSAAAALLRAHAAPYAEHKPYDTFWQKTVEDPDARVLALLKKAGLR